MAPGHATLLSNSRVRNSLTCLQFAVVVVAILRWLIAEILPKSRYTRTEKASFHADGILVT